VTFPTSAGVFEFWHLYGLKHQREASSGVKFRNVKANLNGIHKLFTVQLLT